MENAPFNGKIEVPDEGIPVKPGIGAVFPVKVGNKVQAVVIGLSEDITLPIQLKGLDNSLILPVLLKDIDSNLEIPVKVTNMPEQAPTAFAPTELQIKSGESKNVAEKINILKRIVITNRNESMAEVDLVFSDENGNHSIPLIVETGTREFELEIGPIKDLNVLANCPGAQHPVEVVMIWR